MTYYVRVAGRIIGTVIAASEDEALRQAHAKFSLSWESGWPVDVIKREGA